MPTVYFGVPSHTVKEYTNHHFSIDVFLSSRAGLDVTVPFSINESLSTASGTDYTISTLTGQQEIEIPASITTGNINFFLTNDNIDEYDGETIVVSLETPTNATIGTLGECTVMINDDDDPPEVYFLTTSYSTKENTGGLPIKILLAGVTSEKEITIPLTLGGTAVEDEDYTISTKEITIPPGAAEAQITLTLIDNFEYELDRTVDLTMGTLTHATQGSPSTLSIGILDNEEPPEVSFSSAIGSEDEDTGAMMVNALLSEPSGLDTVVHFSVSNDSTATGAGEDYTIINSPITIPAGTTFKPITITLIDDDKDEVAAETVIVELDTPENAELGSTVRYTATIVDDDGPPTVNLSSATASAAESAGTMAITAELSHASDYVVSMPFNLADVTAVEGIEMDYNLITPSPLIFAPGDLVKDVSIALNSDDLDEADETFTLTMDPPGNGVAGTVTTCTVTIVDSDPPPEISFTEPGLSGDEDGSDDMIITVELAKVSSLDVTVDFTLAGSMATSADYDITASPITIPAGQLTQT
ncbi:MAG: hypothetical protein GY859_08355, partial [Desulfobacterales bacterium]|nr:hypothetical protein [Desulfobacterales bacterium]